MKILSFNLDPFPKDKAERSACFEAIGKIVKPAKPEFLVFQNVTFDDIKKIVAESRWATGYNVVKPRVLFEFRFKPQVAIFSKWPVISEGPLAHTTIDYNETSTDKFFQKAYYEINDKKNRESYICIANTSMEADLKATYTREKQLNQACTSLVAEDAFLVGNLCIDNDVDGDVICKGGWKDAWLGIPGNTEANGCTYDPDNNPLLKGDQFGPRRLDRLYFKSRHFELESVEVVGKGTYKSPKGNQVCISKNYGLLVTLLPLDRPKEKVVLPEDARPIQFQRPEWSVHFQEKDDQTIQEVSS